MTPLVDRRPDYDELLRLAEAAPSNAADVPSVPTAEAFHRAASPDVVAALIRENRQQAERIAALENLLTDAEYGRDMLDVAYKDLYLAALRVTEATQPVDRDAAILDLECVALNGEPCAESRP